MQTVENESLMKLNDINPEDYQRQEKEVDRAWYEADEEMAATGGNQLFESYAEQEVQEQEEQLKVRQKQMHQPISRR